MCKHKLYNDIVISLIVGFMCKYNLYVISLVIGFMFDNDYHNCYDNDSLWWPKGTLPRQPEPMWAARKPPLADKGPPFGCGWLPRLSHAPPKLLKLLFVAS